MRARNLLRWRRALNEVKFKHEELSLVIEICEAHAVDFQMFLENYCSENDIDLEKLNQDKGVPVIPPRDPRKEKLIVSEKEEQKEEDEMYPVFKELFKKLALNLHPDRSFGLTDEEREVRLSMFKEAKRALDDGDYFLLLDMSEKFDVRIPSNIVEQTRWMKERIRELDRQIKSKKSTYDYVFSETESEDEKVKIVKNFLSQFFQI
jgi:hypothetical protein